MSYYWGKEKPFEILRGKTLVTIRREGDEELIFVATDGSEYKMYHEQSCCENVSIDDIVGDFEDLIGSIILVAEVATNSDNPKSETSQDQSWTWTDESHTWTFYKIATVKGWVDIKWYGSSNGYYSESVHFIELKPPTVDRESA